MGHFLRGVFGVQSLTVITSSYFRYTYTPIANDVGSAHVGHPYTVEIFRDVTSSELFSGVNFGMIDFSVAPNQDLRMTVGLVAKNKTFVAATASAGNITFPTSPTGIFKFDTASLTFDGVAVDRIENLRMSFNNQIGGIPTLANTREITRIRRTGPQMVRISGTIEFLSIQDALDFENQTEKVFQANFVKANSFALFFQFPRMIYSSFPRQIPGRERLTVDFEAMGRYSPTSRYAMRVELTTVNTF
jgi:hypothetical protein